ncbi:MAG: MOSC domain-containing protein, partial [Planctomycetaceae bacterium]|nr:MOSC domain-containing protein [Planctomycetaceae bacterium]
GTVVFRVAKPCPRCTMTTVDPDTGVKEIEPLKTLASYRKDESGGVMFGQNLLHETIGEVAVGMQIEVLE